MDADTNFNNAIDSEFIKHPGLSSDAFTYKRLVNNENSSRDKKIITLIDIERKHNIEQPFKLSNSLMLQNQMLLQNDIIK